tara:strand:- start:557 stop:1111 length:555 start_codon:yes stop_codon:yes gene_type:complete
MSRRSLRQRRSENKVKTKTTAQRREDATRRRATRKKSDGGKSAVAKRFPNSVAARQKKDDGGKSAVAKRFPDSVAARQSGGSDKPKAKPKTKVTVQGPKAAKRTLAQERLREAKKIVTDVKSPPKPPPTSSKPFGSGSSKVIRRNGKNLANVSAEQLKKTGMSLRQYMNAWNKTGSRPTKKKAK